MDKITTVTIPFYVLQDLITMARQSPQYKAGYAWAAEAMNVAAKAKNQALAEAETIRGRR